MGLPCVTEMSPSLLAHLGRWHRSPLPWQPALLHNWLGGCGDVWNTEYSSPGSQFWWQESGESRAGRKAAQPSERAKGAWFDCRERCVCGGLKLLVLISTLKEPRNKGFLLFKVHWQKTVGFVPWELAFQGKVDGLHVPTLHRPLEGGNNTL